MSDAIPAAIALNYGACASVGTAPGGRRLARRLCQAMVLLPLFTLMLEPEYLQAVGDPETKSMLYRAAIGPLRLVDAALLGLIAVHITALAVSRVTRLRLPRSIAVPGVVFLLAIGTAAIYGSLHGGVNLFFDWRALALGLGMYVVFALWLQTPQDVRSATILWSIFMAVRIASTYLQFARGGGDTIVGVRIPVFDGPTLSAMVFTAILALGMPDAEADRPQKFLWTCLSAAAYLLVLSCFRRTFWAELGVGTLILLLIQKQGRARKMLLVTLATAVVAALVGGTFFERVQSLDFSRGESEFSQDNPDHVGEVLDAWEQVQRRPLLGIGLGRSFQTLRVQTWKEESVMVHNAPLHVWLKYGLLGLVSYVWFHCATFRWLWRVRKQMPAEKMRVCGHGTTRHAGACQFEAANRKTPEVWMNRAIASSVLAYLAAEFMVSLGFAPWPYSALQSTTLIAFALALAMAGAPPCKFQLSR